LPLVFSVTGFINTREFFNTYGIFQILRDLYEPIVFWLFVLLLEWKVGGPKRLSDIFKKEGKEFTKRHMYFGMIQFIFVKPLTSIGFSIMEFSGHSDSRPTFIFLTVVKVLSTITALLILLKVWRTTLKYLPGFKSHFKGILVKLPVFLALVQSVVLSNIQKSNLIDSYSEVVIQYSLIVIEMLFFGIAYYFAFAVEDFMNPEISGDVVMDVPYQNLDK